MALLTDISVDLLLIARFGFHLQSFHPVPASAEYVAAAAKYEPRAHVQRVAPWYQSTELESHAPSRGGCVAHSAINLHDTSVAFAAPAWSVAQPGPQTQVDATMARPTDTCSTLIGVPTESWGRKLTYELTAMPCTP